LSLRAAVNHWHTNGPKLRCSRYLCIPCIGLVLRAYPWVLAVATVTAVGAYNTVLSPSLGSWRWPRQQLWEPIIQCYGNVTLQKGLNSPIMANMTNIPYMCLFGVNPGIPWIRARNEIIILRINNGLVNKRLGEVHNNAFL